jgi:outer membrane receptor for ferrienterochelin and colicins
MSLHHTPLRLTVLATALAAALSAQAQQAKPDGAAKPAIQKVEVKGSTDAYDARRDDTASKIVLNHDEIVKYGDTNVLDVLKRLPGVTVSGASGRGGEVRMRGLGSGYTQFLINGERAPAGFSMDSLTPDSIERIEVLRAATAEYSTQSIAGTINIVLKKAIKSAQREMKAGIGGSKEAFTPTYNLQLSDRKDQLSYSLTVNGVHNSFKRDTPYVEDGVDGGVAFLRNSSFHEDGQFDGINIGPRLNWNFANGDTLTSQTFINAGRFQRTSESLTAGGFGSQPANPYAEWDSTNENYFLRSDLNWVKKLEGGAKLDLKIGGVIGALRNDSYRRGYAALNGQKTLENYVKSRGTDRGFTSTGKYSQPIGQGHALAVGWDGGISTRDDSRIQYGQRTVNGVAGPDNSDEQFTGDVTRLAAYAQDEWNVTPRWSVYMGVRWEGISTDVTGTSFVDTGTRTSVWSPLFQTLYKLPDTKGDQLRFALTRTYKAPNVQAVIPRRFTSTNSDFTDPDIQGNPDLKPELATGIDASYEHYWGQGAMVSVSASMRRIANYTRTSIEESPTDPTKAVSKSINDGTATTRGLEFEAKFPLKSVFANAPALDLRANFSRNWSTVDAVTGPNNRLDQQTPFSSTLSLDYKTGKLTTGGSYSFRNGGLVRVSDEQTVYSSVRRDLEMYGLWKFDPKTQLRLSLSNLLAQDFVNESAFVLENGRAIRRRTTTPGNVLFRATAEMKF